MGLDANAMLPEMGSKKRSSRFIIVDFPQPEGPTKAAKLPGGIVRLISFKTRVSVRGYLKVREESEISPPSSEPGGPWARFSGVSCIMGLRERSHSM